jgi:3-dehydroquinate dehydratase/shikimate dehydrogenase
MPPLAHLEALAASALGHGAAAFKAVVCPLSSADTLALMAWAHGPQPLPTLAIALGPEGLWSRLLVGRQRCPGPYTLVRLDHSGGVAPGQPSWSAADGQYRAWQVGPKTKIFGVVGSPVGHSRSPALHARAIAARDLDAIYLPFEVPGPLPPWLAGAHKALRLAGLSVTAPHKEAALTCATSLSFAAQASAAVNTLVACGSGGWHGDNTDAQAAAASLAALGGGALSGRRVLILGTGGAARAVAFGLCQAGAQVALWGRRAQAATQLCAQLQRHPQAQGKLTALTDEDLDDALAHCEAVVHCTPVGMAGTGTEDGAPLLSDRQLKRLPASAVVFDTVYAPAQTALMAAAQARGLTVWGGLDMLRRQAEAQYELFYGPLAGVRRGDGGGPAPT